jgi:hypothetical protein
MWFHRLEDVDRGRQAVVRSPNLAPEVHLFVCANRRTDSPLGPGCGDYGEAVYADLKREVGDRGLVQQVWVTKTHCLGICPRRGATVATYFARTGTKDALTTEVEAGDASTILDGLPARRDFESDALERELAAAEELQASKVLDLARRLRPQITQDDVQNPHDFPELADPDWQYADGVRAGIASALAALRSGTGKKRR